MPGGTRATLARELARSILATMRKIRRADPELETRWLAQVREIATRVLAGQRADLYLFGSRARGDARLASDIDLAVDAPELPGSVLAALEQELEESTVPVRVQVVDLRQAGEDLRARVLEEGIRWIASKSA